MGIFHQQSKVFNRAPVALRVRFDGQETDIPPGESYIPTATVPFAKNQNPIMGKSDPYNPHISGGKYLIAEIGYDSPEECQPLSKKEWEEHLGRPCRIDETILFENILGPGETYRVKGVGRRTAARSLYDTNVKGSGSDGSVFGGADARE